MPEPGSFAAVQAVLEDILREVCRQGRPTGWTYQELGSWTVDLMEALGEDE